MNGSIRMTHEGAGQRRILAIACGILAVVTLGAHLSRAQHPALPAGRLGYQWLQQELTELKRLIFQRQLAERQVRTEKGHAQASTRRRGAVCRRCAARGASMRLYGAAAVWAAIARAEQPVSDARVGAGCR